MILNQLIRPALVGIGFYSIFFIALAGVACTQSDENSDDTLVAAAAVVVAQAQAASSGSSSSTGCSGSGHCKMYVTNANATLNAGVTGLDSQCASDANKPSGSSTFKAMVADGTNRIACTSANCGGGTSEHTNWVLKASKEYRRTDGTTVIATTTANGVFSFPLTAAIQTTIVGTNSTVTGLNTNWTSSASDCTNFTSTGANTSNGLHDETSTNLLSIGTSGCGNTMKVICVEQ